MKNRPSKGLVARWRGFWLWRAGYGFRGRLCARLAALGVGPYRHQYALAHMSAKGFIAPSAEIIDIQPKLGLHVYVGERVVIARWSGSGFVELQDRAQVNRDCSLEIEEGGSITIGSQAGVQPGCIFAAALHPIVIGKRAQIAAYCCFYNYDHGMDPEREIFGQPLTSKGPILVGHDAWLGVGVKVMSGVSIGAGAVIGSGSVVTRDIPDNAIAAGVPARIIKLRSELAPEVGEKSFSGT